MKKILIAIGLTATTLANAQFKEGKKNIDQLCGCYTVDFKYAETFSPDTAYQFHKREHSKALEWVTPIYEGNTIILQHLLVINDSMVIKHWREDWTYETKEQWVYIGNKEWKKIMIENNKGAWTQTVWEVDDAPRYQGTAKWITTNNQTFWMNTTNAPLPRREYTTRNDYHILRRGNKIAINNNSWVHEQDNDKIKLVNGQEQLIAQEKGMNIYTKTADSKCAVAEKWWKENAIFWNLVRNQWQQKINSSTTIKLQSKVEGKRLDEYLTQYWKQWKAGNNSNATIEMQVQNTIGNFLQTTQQFTN
jgi:hypothetical protein